MTIKETPAIPHIPPKSFAKFRNSKPNHPTKNPGQAPGHAPNYPGSRTRFPSDTPIPISTSNSLTHFVKTDILLMSL